jgi:hypothetical protein
MWLRRAGWLAAALAFVAAAPTLASAQTPGTHPNVPPPGSPEQLLVSRYAPILELRKQENPPCDTGEEQYRPTSVETVLGNPRVAFELIRFRTKRVLRHAPTAKDIAGLGDDFYLNLPGDPIESECVYARDFRRLRRAGKAPDVTYARIATQPGHHGLVVQYWFFWYFNQFNDVHEGDWEGMQIAFDDANTPAQALAQEPTRMVLFQHAGGETADWDDAKVEKEGTHPVVYPAAGSHATFYGPAVYLQTGSGGAGLGCDNTTEPLQRVVPKPILVPTDPTQNGPFPWLTYEGHWGQKEKGYNNGPAGPNTKTVWREPFTWMDDARLASPTLPTSGYLGPGATSAFCSAVAAVSSIINAQSRSPLGVLVLLAVVVALLFLPVIVTRWRPVVLHRLRERRRFGQLLRAARQLYGRYWRVFVPIGLCSIALTATVEGLQALYTQAAGKRDVGVHFSIAGAHFDFALTIAGTLGPIALALIAATTIAVIRSVDLSERPSFGGAWDLTLRRFWRLVLVHLYVDVLLILMVITVIGIPFAAWKYIGWQFVQQEILFEDKGVRDAMRGSSRIVRHHWWRTLGIAGFLALFSAAVGPVLGWLLIFADFSLVSVDVVSAVVYALLVPYVSIARTLLYFDLCVRKQAEDELPEGERPRRGLQRLRRGPARPDPGLQPG